MYRSNSTGSRSASSSVRSPCFANHALTNSSGVGFLAFGGSCPRSAARGLSRPSGSAFHEEPCVPRTCRSPVLCEYAVTTASRSWATRLSNCARSAPVSLPAKPSTLRSSRDRLPPLRGVRGVVSLPLPSDFRARSGAVFLRAFARVFPAGENPARRRSFPRARDRKSSDGHGHGCPRCTQPALGERVRRERGTGSCRGASTCAGAGHRRALSASP